ncbi:MAG: transporter substrate-binding domain-containing protein [Chthoniobacterales bacterium]
MRTLSFFLILLCGLASCAKKPEAAKPIVIGMELNFPPFEMKTPAGEPSGVSVDLAQAMSQFLGRKIQIEDMPFDALIPSLKTGKIDLILSSMTRTEERAQSIDFSDPYLSTGVSILAGKNSGINSVADLDQPARTIAVKKGTTSHIYATEHLKKAKVLVFDNDGTGVLEVTQGKADAFLYDQMSIYQYYKKNPMTTKAILEPFQKENWAIGIRKDNDALRKDVNRFLADFKARKGFDALGDKYLGEDKKAFAAMGFPFYF